MVPEVEFPRPLYPPTSDHGPVPDGIDVVGVKRAISRAGYFPWGVFDDTYNAAIAKGVKAFQQQNGLTATGFYGEPTHERLRVTRRKGQTQEWAFDAIAIKMMADAEENLNRKPENLALAKIHALLNFCRLFDGPYVYGGEHDGSFYDDDPHDGFDCSSSTSFVLWKFGLLGVSQAQVSGWFESWGEPGRGKYLTVHAAEDHVWIEFNMDGAYHRFDTSPHGEGVRGPRVRSVRRSDSRFVHRHPQGM